MANDSPLSAVAQGATTGAVAGSAGGPLSAVAGAGVGAVGSFLGNLAMNSIEQKDYRKNQRANFKYSQLAQMSEGTNMKESLQRAGISPAVMSQGNFTPVAPNNAPVQNKAVAPLQALEALQVGSQIELNKSTANLQNAEAGKVKSETDVIQFKYKNDSDYRDMLTSWVQGEYGEEYNEWAQKHSDLVAKGEHMNGVAFLLAHSYSLDALLRDEVRNVEFDEAGFNSQVAQMRRYSPRIARAVASLPQDQRNELYSRITHLSVMNNLLSAERDETFAKTDEVKQNLQKLRAERDKIETETANMLVNSPILAGYRGDKKAVALGVVKSVSSFVPFVNRVVR